VYGKRAMLAVPDDGDQLWRLLAVRAAHNVDVERRRGRARTGTLSFEDSFVLPAA